VGRCGGTATACEGALQQRNGEWSYGCGTARARGELQRRDSKSVQGELQRQNIERGWI